MKHWWLRSIVTLVVFASLNSSLCQGAAEPTPAAEPWVSLFNGFDFTGWKIVALSSPAPAVVEDGAMVLRQRRNTTEHTFVASRQKYSDFIHARERFANGASGIDSEKVSAARKTQPDQKAW